MSGTLLLLLLVVPIVMTGAFDGCPSWEEWSCNGVCQSRFQACDGHCPNSNDYWPCGRNCVLKSAQWCCLYPEVEVEGWYSLPLTHTCPVRNGSCPLFSYRCDALEGGPACVHMSQVTIWLAVFLSNFKTCVSDV